MNGYSNFRKTIGLKGTEIEKLTGYTRQGMHGAFKNIKVGKRVNKKFLVCINTVIDKKIEHEKKLYEEKLNKLKSLKEEFKMEEIR